MTPQQPPGDDAPRDVPPDPQAAAFFDVDNTMMIGASIFHFAKGLAARDFFSWRDLARFTLRQARLRLRGESHHDMHHTRESALAFIAGKDVAEIIALGEEIYDEEMSDRVWSGTLALAQQHLDAGQRVWLVTATPVELATIIAQRLHLTGALGTVAESADGRYTGHLVGEVLHGEAKAQAVRELAEREGLDLDKCSAYSDSINDMPLLSLVGHAVAVNPDSALRAEAKQHGWEIRDFRTGRKAARIGVPSAIAAGAVGGAVAVGVAVWRTRHRAGSASLAMILQLGPPERPCAQDHHGVGRAAGRAAARRAAGRAAAARAAARRAAGRAAARRDVRRATLGDLRRDVLRALSARASRAVRAAGRASPGSSRAPGR